MLHQPLAFSLSSFTFAIGLLVWVVAAWLGTKAVGAIVRAWSSRTRTRADDLLVGALEGAAFPVVAAAGIWFGLRIADVASPAWESALLTGVQVVVIAAVARAMARLLGGVADEYGGRSGLLQAGGGFLRYVFRFAVYGVALMITLDVFGISITPLLTAFGLGGLALALALQDTLGNVFAGLYITVDRPLREGDFIELDSGQRGYVVGRTWRSVRIRELSNNLIVIPNNRITSSIVKNYDLPERPLAVLVEASVAYESDLDRVEAVVVAVARDALARTPGADPAFQPFIRFHTFGESGVGFTVILRAQQFVDQYLLKHEFVKALHREFARQGIVIPYPIRSIRLVADSPGPPVPQEAKP